MNESRVGVVCDAGPLIHLDELSSLSLLNDFEKILIPEQVWMEVAHHRPQALTHPDLSIAKIAVDISSKPVFQALVKTLSLDLGEQAALSLMEIHASDIFITDDAAARLAADALGYKVHGTIGIMVRAIRRKRRSKEEVIELLRALPMLSTLHIRPSVLQAVIDKLQ
jgi:predicted nucleic acid-binding protein